MLLVIAVLFIVATAQGWSSTSGEVSTATAERHGIAYLRPLNTLVSTLAGAQSTAVRGGQVAESEVTAAMDDVDDVDDRYGSELQASKRWSDIRRTIREILAAKPTGVEAYEQYGEASAVVRQLQKRIADSSELVLDRAIDSSYLVDAALQQLPDVLIAAGRAADLATLDAATPIESQDSTVQTRIAVARYDVAVAAEAVGVGLAKSLDGTASRTLGPHITGQLDAFRSAVDSFVPSGTRLRGLDRTDASNLYRTATLVRQAAGPLADAVFGELDSILSDRVDTLGWQRLRAMLVTLFGLLVALLLGWWMIPRSKAGAEADSDDIEGSVPEQRAADRPRGARPETAVIDPRDLRAVEELMHAGRAIRGRRRERDHDAG